MIYRALSSTGDYTFGAGSNNFLENDYAVAQAIKTKILLFYQEWWEDLGEGIPVFQSLLGQFNNLTIQNSLSQLLSQRILDINEVTSIVSIDINYDKTSRTISAEIVVSTSYGTVVTTGVNL